MEEHISFTHIIDGLTDLGLGWEFDEDTKLIDIWNNPPRKHNASVTDKQTVMLGYATLIAIKDLAKSTESVRRAIDRLPARLEKQRLSEELKLAKEQRKTADARVRAAEAELAAKFCEVPVMYQVDHGVIDELKIRWRF